ncbi:MAG: YlbF family regulator [Streptococcaceae bacterium]|jgi:cell fate (sporulation/competence/biofilm development) regulator YmcA (YheA/YmcA/DUF963 family)|nr:YlbF family regulator [Streptococcaceae bacterium]
MSVLDEKIKARLSDLTTYLSDFEEIVAFKAVAKKLEDNEQIKQWTAELERAQKDAVLYQRIDKKSAAKIANQKADELNEQINQHPLVISYRKELKDVNDLLHYIAEKLEFEINQSLEDK